MAWIRSNSVYIGAAVIAVVMSFIVKYQLCWIRIPTAVLGGISIALFGVIMASGLKILVEQD